MLAPPDHADRHRPLRAMTRSAFHRLLSARRGAALTLSSALLLPGCATVSLAPTPAPPPAPVVSDADRYPPPRLREPPAAPIETPLPAAEAPAISLPSAATVTPLPPPAPSPLPSSVPPTEPAAPRAQRDASALATSKATPAGPAASAPSQPAPPVRRAGTPSASTAADDRANGAAAGRWSVQVGVFAVAQNAETIRARVAQRLLERPLPGATLRTARRDGRIHVLVGDLPDRAGAQRLAAQLRELLQQDVVLFQW
jgi:hypothetical protein